MNIVIAGSRNFNDYPLLQQTLSSYIKDLPKQPITIISGGAKGADQLGERYAKEHKLSIQQFPPDWDLWGKAAGPIRNRKMAQVADVIFVFWDGKSKGSQSMIQCAKNAKAQCFVIRSYGND